MVRAVIAAAFVAAGVIGGIAYWQYQPVAVFGSGVGEEVASVEAGDTGEEKSQSETREYQGDDGRTIIKGVLPGELQEVYDDLQSLSKSLDADVTHLYEAVHATRRSAAFVQAMNMLDEADELIRQDLADGTLDEAKMKGDFETLWTTDSAAPQVRRARQQISEENESVQDLVEQFTRLVEPEVISTE